MLDVALNFLTAELNAYLLARGARKATDEVGKAEVGRLVDDAGKWAIPDDHIGVTLVHVEEERVLHVLELDCQGEPVVLKLLAPKGSVSLEGK